LICAVTVPATGVSVAVGEGGSGVDVGRDVWLGAGVGDASVGVAKPFDGATGLQAEVSKVKVMARSIGS
jgi:hypothetical protein